MATKGVKRTSEEIGKCIICEDNCDENKSITSEQWDNFKLTAEKWQNLDKYGMIYNDTNWNNCPTNIFYHKHCKLNFSNQRKLEQAVKRFNKEDHHTNTLGI